MQEMLPARRLTYHSVHPDILEPIRPAVLFLQPWFSGVKMSCLATRALRVVRAVEVGYVIIPDILEPEMVR